MHLNESGPAGVERAPELPHARVPIADDVVAELEEELTPIPGVTIDLAGYRDAPREEAQDVLAVPAFPPDDPSAAAEQLEGAGARIGLLPPAQQQRLVADLDAAQHPEAVAVLFSELSDAFIDPALNAEAERLVRSGVPEEDVIRTVALPEFQRVARERLAKVVPTHHRAYADLLARTGNDALLCCSVRDLQHVSLPALARRLASSSRSPEWLLRTIDDFSLSGEERRAVLHELVTTNPAGVSALVTHPRAFPELSRDDLVDAALATPAGREALVTAFRQLGPLEPTRVQGIVQRLLDAGDGALVAAHAGEFQGVDATWVLAALQERGLDAAIVQNAARFPSEVQECIVDGALANGHLQDILEHISDFQPNVPDLAQRIVACPQGGWSVLAEHLENFQHLSAEVFRDLGAHGHGGDALRHIDAFDGVDVDAALLAGASSHGDDVIRGAVRLGRTLPRDVVRALVSHAPNARSLVTYADVVAPGDRRWLFEEILRQKLHGLAIDAFTRFPDVTSADELASHFLESNDLLSLVTFLSNPLLTLDRTRVCTTIIQRSDPAVVQRLLGHLPSMPGIDVQAVISEIIASGRGDVLAGELARDSDALTKLIVGVDPAALVTALPEGDRAFIAELDTLAPGFSVVLSRNTEALIAALGMPHEQTCRLLQQTPALSSTVVENPRYGWRLIAKYPELSAPSRAKVDAILTADSAVRTSMPDVTPGSPAYRSAVQDRLRPFGRNQEILTDAAAHGVDVDAWLGNEERVPFRLEAAEAVPFSQRVKLPMDTVVSCAMSTVTAIQDALTPLLAERPGATLHIVDEDARATLATQEALLRTAREAGDVRRVEGLTRSIEGLQRAASREKPLGDTLQRALRSISDVVGAAPLTEEQLVAHVTAQWEQELRKHEAKGRADAATDLARKIEVARAGRANPAYESLLTEVRNRAGDERVHGREGTLQRAQRALVEAERAFDAADAGEPDAIARAKQQRARASMELRREVAKLELRIRELLGQHASTDGPPQPKGLLDAALAALAPEGDSAFAERVRGSIDTALGEARFHYGESLAQLEGYFSGKSEMDLSGRAMSVSTWSRNPHVDLYQGNYSPCCISIEGEIHGGNSPIADYLTDLGMQVVNVTDEERRAPVLAAWCWLGVHPDGRTALVVDNVEANPRYADVAPHQLWEQLRAYLERYAQQVGVDALVLGMQYTKVPRGADADALPSDTSGWRKLGGYNPTSRSNGEYYCDTRPDSVPRNVWQRERAGAQAPSATPSS